MSNTSDGTPHVFECDGCGQTVEDPPSWPTCTDCDGEFQLLEGKL